MSAPASTSAAAPTRGIPEASPLLLKAAPAIFLLFWSGGFAAGKVGLAYTGPLTFLAVRYALVLLVLLPLVLIMRPPLPRTPAAWGHLAVVGFLIQGLYFALGYLALAMDISSGAVALIVSLQPILVALAAPRMSGERVGRWAWVGLGLGLGGAALVILARSAVEALPALGVLAAVGALGGMTVGTLYEKRFGIAQHPVTANTVQYAAGLAATLPLAFLLEDHTVEWSLPLGLSLLYLIVCNSLIALTLLLMMIRRGEVSRVSALFFLVPPMAALIGWLVLDEQMPPLAWVGLALAAAGVALATRANDLPTIVSNDLAWSYCRVRRCYRTITRRLESWGHQRDALTCGAHPHDKARAATRASNTSCNLAPRRTRRGAGATRSRRARSAPVRTSSTRTVSPVPSTVSSARHARAIGI